MKKTKNFNAFAVVVKLTILRLVGFWSLYFMVCSYSQSFPNQAIKQLKTISFNFNVEMRSITLAIFNNEIPTHTWKLAHTFTLRSSSQGWKPAEMQTPVPEGYHFLVYFRLENKYKYKYNPCMWESRMLGWLEACCSLTPNCRNWEFWFLNIWLILLHMACQSDLVQPGWEGGKVFGLAGLLSLRWQLLRGSLIDKFYCTQG